MSWKYDKGLVADTMLQTDRHVLQIRSSIYTSSITHTN
jgi:hypothetical protein